jgi:hypothetical protein
MAGNQGWFRIPIDNISDAKIIKVGTDLKSNDFNWTPDAGFVFVTLSGSAKTYKIQWGNAVGSTPNAYIKDATLEIWRVS